MDYNAIFKIIVIELIRKTLLIFKLFPLQNDKIFFSSFDGTQYSDSPKYISDYYYNTCKDLKQVWAFDKKIIKKVVVPVGIKTVTKGSISYYYQLFTSKQIVINDFISTIIEIRKGQILVNTWHGGGTFKRIGMTLKNPSEYDRYFYSEHAKNTTAYLLSSAYFKKTVVEKSFLFYGKTLKSGMPRNAILFDDNPQIKKKVLNYYGISDDDHIIVLYAPTYRNNGSNDNFISQHEELDIERCIEAFENKLGKKVNFIYRTHHLIRRQSNRTKNYFDGTRYPDIQELLYTADYLLSDYSSCMWDFCLMKKPIFVFAPDINEYRNEQNFFMQPNDWAFPICESNDELVNAIHKFDEDKYHQDLNIYMAKLGSYENANAIQIVCDWLDQKRY